ncbi:MAG TPA: hypothetical protein VF297_27910 [Pyrinomonadaceae bacterium]
MSHPVSPQVALDRDALYYPYIRIRDVNWLKATLLSFPHVYRMVPAGYELADDPRVRPFREVLGPRGRPLLIEAGTSQHTVVERQRALLNKIKSHDPADFERFKLARTQQELGEHYNSFEIHRGKMVELLDYFAEENLAWPSRRANDPYGDWYGVHPDLGKAVMSTLALAIADGYGLDIVTNDREVHHTAVTRDDDQIFDELVGREAGPAHAGVGGVDTLAELVITTTFDLSALDAERIAEIQKDGNGLQRFKNSLLPIVQGIPRMTDEQALLERYEQEAERVRKEWREYEKSLRWYGLKAIADVSEIKFPEVAAGIAAFAPLGIGAGLAAAVGLGLMVYGGVKVMRERRENVNKPLQYLSRIQDAGATLVLPPMIPSQTNTSPPETRTPRRPTRRRSA